MQISSTTLNPLSGPTGAKAREDLQKAAKAFEAVFMRQMIGAMRSASLDEGLGDSSATQQFRDMADARTADAMAENGHGFGIASLLIKQLEGRIASAAPQTDAAATGEAKA
ncbi:rod-binding protein [Sphingobium phenoxybenzoativorans]|uniref:Rod-binding protein n=1 Tax=Sphingobium phenoxybenzoativorans TaxID=1592790 RepID=A0A975Q3U1_9SPHN|nr:rod-binding protein [Sphingobium phenoxybenzoativorans]QUT08425.1 rod-binding protein [Sphingobium phenoxybenzoativorans]